MMPMPIPVGKMFYNLGGGEFGIRVPPYRYGRPLRKASRRGEKISRNGSGHRSNPRRKN